jgi:HEAT repeats
MECRDVADLSVLKLTGEIDPRTECEVDRHLSACASCRAERDRLGTAWEALNDGYDPHPAPSSRFSRETLSRMEAAMLRRAPRTSAFTWVGARRVAALVVMGVGGFFSARLWAPAGGPATASAPMRPDIEAVLRVSNDRVVDASRTLPDLSGKPRLANVTYQPVDARGRLAVSFDVTTRYTVVGRPDEKGIESLLTYLVAGGGANEGARGQALDLVSERIAAGGVAPSDGIVGVLAKTLTTDRNPGVRKKAAEALSQLPPTPDTRDALIACLKAEPVPGIRMIAVEGLAKAAVTLKDRPSIETLQEKANDERENGYLRVKAASALGRLAL